jgi:glutamyl-tRNA synthetase
MQGLQTDLGALEVWSAPAIHGVIESVASRHGVGLGKVAQPLRVALCGGPVSPPIDATAALLGRTRVIERIARALKFIAGDAS